MQISPIHNAEMSNPDRLRKERASRLRTARRRAGHESATAAAAFLGIPYGTYSGHENAARGIKDDELKLYARRFKVRLPWLSYGEGEIGSGPITTMVVGKIGAGSEITPIDDHAKGDGLDDIDLPPGMPPDAIAVLVEGNSQYPRYFDGEIVFYKRDGRAPSELIGQECVVKTRDGRMMLKTIKRGSKRDRFTLESWNAPPIEDCALEWAGPVIRPRWR